MDNNLINILKQLKKQGVKVTEEKKVLIENQIPKGLNVLTLQTSVLFVDIRDSTLLTKTIGIKNMTKLYHAFSKIVAKAVYDNCGRIVQFMGDGFMAAFESCKTDKRKYNTGENAIDAIKDINQYIHNEYREVFDTSMHFECGYGLAFGHIYMTRLKQKTYKLQSFGIFPGDSTNNASKYCGYANKNEVMMDETSMNQCSLDCEEVKVKEGKVYKWKIN